MQNLWINLRDESPGAKKCLSVAAGNLIRAALAEALAEAVKGGECYGSIASPGEASAMTNQRRYYQNAASFLSGFLHRFTESGKAARGVMLEMIRSPWDKYTPSMTPLDTEDGRGNETEPSPLGRSRSEPVVLEHPQSTEREEPEEPNPAATGIRDSGNPGTGGGVDGPGLGKSAGADNGRDDIGDSGGAERGSSTEKARKKLASAGKAAKARRESAGRTGTGIHHPD